MFLDDDDIEPAHFDLSDFDWMVAALAYAHAEGLTLKDIMPSVCIASTGEEFDVGVCSLIKLKGLGHNGSVQTGSSRLQTRADF